MATNSGGRRPRSASPGHDRGDDHGEGRSRPGTALHGTTERERSDPAFGLAGDERAHVERQVEGVRVHLELVGIPRAMTAAWTIWPCAAIDIVVTHLYEQTPGPGAGEPLR